MPEGFCKQSNKTLKIYICVEVTVNVLALVSNAIACIMIVFFCLFVIEK